VTVYLVGAGPGDPGLLTVRGADLLSRADVVVFDPRAGSVVVDLAPAHAERVDVGGTSEHQPMTQADITDLVSQLARAHHTVVRLIDGDPFVFAAGRIEAEALTAAGVAFEIVPGVTPAIAGPAYAGIPVTKGASSTAVAIVSSRSEDAPGSPTPNWDAIVNSSGTIVILTHGDPLSAIVERLLATGVAPSTPAAVISRATTPRQTSTRTTVAGLAEVQSSDASVVVVGDVVAIDLTWFENRPLFGRKVVVTRSRAQAQALSRQLIDLGAEVVEIPTIAIAEPSDGGAALHAAARRIRDFDWLVVTSPNGARRTMEAFVDVRALGGVKVAAIGPATAQALAESKLVADLVPAEYVAESLLAALGTPTGAGGRVLIARAAVARDVLPDGLAAAGWQVEVVEAYRTVRPDPREHHRRELADADIITFTSSSTVVNFVEAFGVEAVPATVGCIGPITATTAREVGLDVAFEASVHTVDGLVDALLQFLAS
jgi:uroporphyrinogen III methyltransferase / synthase